MLTLSPTPCLLNVHLLENHMEEAMLYPVYPPKQYITRHCQLQGLRNSVCGRGDTNFDSSVEINLFVRFYYENSKLDKLTAKYIDVIPSL